MMYMESVNLKRGIVYLQWIPTAYIEELCSAYDYFSLHCKNLQRASRSDCDMGILRSGRG
jgi:hypothetical protein